MNQFTNNKENFVILICLQTSHAITFMLHELAKYPKVQEKLHQEVVSVLGRKGLPSDKDMQSLPYVTACMREALRCGTSTTNVCVPASFPGSAQLSIPFTLCGILPDIYVYM